MGLLTAILAMFAYLPTLAKSTGRVWAPMDNPSMREKAATFTIRRDIASLGPLELFDGKDVLRAYQAKE